MRVKRAAIAVAVVCAISVLLALYFWQRAEQGQPAVSHLPPAGSEQKWRVAYYQGGDYIDYAANLRALAAALAEQGWMAEVQIPAFDDPEDAASVWQHLSTHAESAYLVFVPDAFWSANWDDAARPAVREEAISRLAHGGDLDLVIAMGTWAGQDLANDRHAVPTMVLSSSGPIRAGIVDSIEDSGFDHVFVEVDPERYRRQIRLFHDVVGFARLGVVYEDSADGRIYANVADLEHVSAERGFELVRCHARDSAVEGDRSLCELQRCYREIAPRIDALWITTHIGEQPKYMPGILEPMFAHDVPTWSQSGEMAVRRGALISIQSTDFEAAGQWYATVMGQILNGISPRELDQVFEMPERVMINLETARRIGFEVPKGVLSVADQVYESIEAD